MKKSDRKVAEGFDSFQTADHPTIGCVIIGLLRMHSLVSLRCGHPEATPSGAYQASIVI